ncbi:hypothetical protein B0H13DRAFT_2565877 [Mycena leptocephala]|nr:hypothetical protein B0H13DRAFT_2565877 [Mycena leptocephala]
MVTAGSKRRPDQTQPHTGLHAPLPAPRPQLHTVPPSAAPACAARRCLAIKTTMSLLLPSATTTRASSSAHPAADIPQAAPLFRVNLSPCYSTADMCTTDFDTANRMTTHAIAVVCFALWPKWMTKRPTSLEALLTPFAAPIDALWRPTDALIDAPLTPIDAHELNVEFSQAYRAAYHNVLITATPSKMKKLSVSDAPLTPPGVKGVTWCHFHFARADFSAHGPSRSWRTPTRSVTWFSLDSLPAWSSAASLFLSSCPLTACHRFYIWVSVSA